MRYSLFHFLRNFPLHYYLRGGLIRSNEPVISVFLSKDESAVLISRGRRNVGYETNILDLPDSPPFDRADARPFDSATAGRSFTGRLLSRCSVNGAPHYCLLPDLDPADLYFNIHSTSNLREPTVEGILEGLQEGPRHVLGSWDDSRIFRWSVFDDRLQSISGQIQQRGSTSRLLLLGIPNDYCEAVETWIGLQGASLLGIVPVPFACLNWFLNALPLSEQGVFFLVTLGGSSSLMVIQHRQVILIRQYLDEVDYIYHEIIALADELQLRQSMVYIWHLKPTPGFDLQGMSGIELNPETLREINGGAVTFRKSGATIQELEGAVPHLLDWMQQQLV